MLTGIGLRNFKAFGDEMQEAPLSKITLIYGPNSGGKTSIIQAILMLKQSLDIPMQGAKPIGSSKRWLIPMGEDVDLGKFETLVHKHESDRKLVIKIAYGRPFSLNSKVELDLTFVAQEPPEADTRNSAVLSNVEHRIINGDKEFFEASSIYEFNEDSIAWSTNFRFEGAYSGSDRLFSVERARNFLPRLTLPELNRELRDEIEKKRNEKDELKERIKELEERLRRYRHSQEESLYLRKRANELEWEQEWRLDEIQNPGLLGSRRRRIRLHVEQEWQGREQELELIFERLQELDLRQQEMPKTSNDELDTLKSNLQQTEKWFGAYEQAYECRRSRRNDLSLSHPNLARSMQQLWEARERGKMQSNWVPSPEELLASTIENLPEEYEDQLRLLTHLGPNRNEPQRLYMVSGGFKASSGVRGENTVHILHRNEEVRNRVNDYFKDFEIPYSLKVEDLKTAGVAVQISLNDIRTEPPTSVTIADVGFGISCILPIIVEGVASPEGSIICVEQPELHLHPRLQAKLVDLMIDTALEDGKQWIVETHSELISRRLQTRIAESKKVNQNVFSSSDVSLLYVDPDPRGNGSEIIEMRLNQFGEREQEGWPEGFFEETESEIDALWQQRMARRRRENAAS